MAAFLLLTVSLLLSPVLQAQDRARVEFPYQNEIVSVDADRLSKDRGDTWSAQGSVIVTYGDVRLKAERLTYQADTGEAVLEGEVELQRGVQWLRADRAEVNLKTDTGILYDVEGFTDAELFVRARSLIKTGPNTYQTRKGFITACEEALPKWSFTVERADIDLDGMARLRHTFFRVKSVPIFYFPLLLLPTEKKERSSGILLPSTGTSSTKGRRISQSFYLTLGRSADATLRSDYYSLRGFAYGGTVRARPNEVTSLEVDVFHINDRVDQGGAIITGVGESRFAKGFRAVADFNVVTNFLVRQVFADDFFQATRPQETSRVFLTGLFGPGSVNFNLAREETAAVGRNTIIRRLPGFGFWLSGFRVGGIPVHLDLDSSLDWMSRVDAQLTTSDLAQRIDLFPQVYTSIPLFQGLRLAPRLGLRETYYSHRLDRPTGESDELEMAADGLHRRYAEFSAELSGWGLSRIYRPDSERAFKHYLEPRVRYRRLGGIQDFEDIIRFDEKDTLVNTHEVEYALYNRIFGRRTFADGEASNREWLSLKIAQKYYFDPDFSGAFQEGFVNQFQPFATHTGFLFGATRRRFSPVTSLIRLAPLQRYSFDIRGDYDPKFDRWRNFLVTGFLLQPGWAFSTSYFITRQVDEGTFESRQLQGQLILGNFLRGPSASSRFSYDAVSNRFLNAETRINYFWECCGVSVEVQGFNVGVRQERQIRFSFFLKGIGTFGNVRQPHTIF